MLSDCAVTLNPTRSPDRAAGSNGAPVEVAERSVRHDIVVVVESKPNLSSLQEILRQSKAVSATTQQMLGDPDGAALIRKAQEVLDKALRNGQHEVAEEAPPPSRPTCWKRRATCARRKRYPTTLNATPFRLSLTNFTGRADDDLLPGIVQ